MKKILYLITQSELGGAQKNVLDLANELKNRYQILVAAGPDGGGKLFKQLADNKIRWRELTWLRRSAANPLRDAGAFFQILFLVLKEKPDIIHLHSSKAGFLGALAGRLAGAKIIYTVHGAVFEAAFSNLARKMFLWLEKFGAYFKDRIICVSQNDRKLWLEHRAAPTEKIFVVPNGLDLAKTEFLSRGEAREYLAGQSANFFEALNGTDETLRIVGTIANFFPEKGLPYLIEAADILINKKRLPNLIFAVIGGGPEKLLLEQMIAEHRLEKNFVLAGMIGRAARCLKAFDIFVLPSIKEGLPYTILEAMAADRPIIASHVGGIPEMIASGENGCLFFPRDSESLAQKIAQLLNEPALRQKFAAASLEKVKEFSLEKMIAATERVYLE